MPNPNTAPFQRKRFWFFYVFLIVGFVSFFHFLGVKPNVYWTITNIVHSIITFVFMHWVKGSPLESSYYPQGKYDKLTFWEQLDEQRQFTPTRKVFTLIPIILFCISSYTAYDELLINLIFAAVVIAPKLPYFHGVRLFGVNSD